nr:MAG TPA: hypothetical protein [Caudoviricetes sp.]
MYPKKTTQITLLIYIFPSPLSKSKSIFHFHLPLILFYLFNTCSISPSPSPLSTPLLYISPSLPPLPCSLSSFSLCHDHTIII